MITSTKK